MAEKNAEKVEDILKEFEENPYTPDNKGPEEIVRLFYQNNVPVLPVVSKRGILLGILKKEKVISELSDLERVKKQKIDEFIMKVSSKLLLDDLLPIVGKIKEFVVINLFGEVFGTWSRLELFTACEQNKGAGIINKEVEKQKEEQILEWMIYLVLEHIPRALYAINEKGKTIFYNSFFEDIYIDKVGKDVDIKLVEKSVANASRNDFYYRKKDKKDIYFYNKDMKFYYEKVPLISNDKNVGFLIFCDRGLNENTGFIFPGISTDGMSLKEMVDSIERSIIVDSIQQNNYNIGEAANSLKVTRKVISNKIDKHSINLKKIDS